MKFPSFLIIGCLFASVLASAQSASATASVPDSVIRILWFDDNDPTSAGHNLVLTVDVSDTPTLAGTFTVFESSVIPSNGNALATLAIGGAGGNSEFVSASNVGAATRFSVRFVSSDPSTYADRDFLNIRPACSPGRFSDSGYGPCTEAPPGTFVDSERATAPVNCVPGSYQPDAGQTFCLYADPGRYVPGFGATTSTRCGMGTYSDNAGSPFCTPAGIGYYVNALGSTAAIECEPGYTTPVISSSICQHDQNTLVSTPTAVWNSPTSGNAEMSFSTSPLVSGTLTVYQSSHIAGSPRVAGTASIASGSSTVTINLGFDEGQTSDQYSIKFESNNSNHNTTYWEMVTPQCGPGNYSSDGFTPCTASPAGKFITGTGSTAPTDCTAGTYQPSVRQTSCLDAPAGTYVSTAGASTPTTCPSGYFSTAIAATSADVCTASTPGYFVDDNDHTRQQPCVKGTFQKSAGQSSCVPAKIGYFVTSEGATKQKRCKRGYTTSSVGATSCKLKPQEPRLPTKLSRSRTSTVYLKNRKTSDGLRVVLSSQSKACKVRRSAEGYRITGTKKGKCSVTMTIKGNKKFASVTRTRNLRVA